jgi:Cu+-exporting ATPase
MATRTFGVGGMTCASCVRRVEKALGAVPGVTSVTVNLATEEASVTPASVAEASLAKALEARGYQLIPAGTAEDGAELRRAGVRLTVAWVLTLPLMAGMFHVHLPWQPQAVLAGLVAFGAGGGFFARALRQAWHREATMDTLVALGAAAAWGFGLHEGLGGAAHPSFETAGALVAFLLTGKFLEAKAKHRATDSLDALLKLAPALALQLKEDGSELEVPSRLLAIGDRVRVKPGSAAPVDGIVLAGRAEVEEALLTGEPLPVPKQPGDLVMAGAMVHGGALDLRATATGRDTWLTRLAAQVAEAQGSRAPAQELADRISAWFVPAILVLAGVTLAAWWWHLGQLDLAWRPAVTVLIIACPCALGLATPVAMAAALGSAARDGLLVRDARAMEALARITDLAFDKTGTLTMGRPALTGVLDGAGRSLLADDGAAILGEDGSTGKGVALRVEAGPVRLGATGATVLRLAAALEQGSEHPVARGILAAAAGQALPAVADFQAHPGLGVSGRIEGRELRLGNAPFLKLAFPEVPAQALAVGLAEGPRLLGLLILADTPRPEARTAVAALRAQGLELHLVSGDRPEAALNLGRELGLAAVHGNCTPGSKRDFIRDLQSRGAVVAFVGDGVNDAPALAQADAGISLPGLDAAQAAAPLNLLRPGLGPLLQARDLARRTRRVVHQNLAWAFGYNLVLVPLAAFNQLDRFGGPMLAGAAMGLSSLTVVLNALRLRAKSKG